MVKISDSATASNTAADSDTATLLMPASYAHQSLQPPTIWKSIRFLIFESPLNLLLLSLPVAIAISNIQWSSEREFSGALMTFIFNFIAIIPLSKLLGTATEEIAMHTNAVIGGLLNATFGNAVELIIAIIALQKNLIRVVQASLLGSILSNLLLVLGFCFLAGGLKYREQSFNMTGAQTSSSMLALSVMAIIIPALFDSVVSNDQSAILGLSRGTSVILFAMYILYLVFQLKTHSHLYDTLAVDIERDIEQEEAETSNISLKFAIGALVVITLLVSVCAEYLVGSIEIVSHGTGLSETFIGLVIVPIVGNAAEHVSAVSVALKNKMDLAVAVAVGSSTQVALLLMPVTCLAGWAMDVPMTLDFKAFETGILLMTVLIVNYVIQDGKSNWLEGAMLLSAYCIISLSFFFYP